MATKGKTQRKTVPAASAGDRSAHLPVLPGSAAMAAALLLLSIFAGLTLWEMAGDSVTSDERIHLPAGYAYWMKREFRLNPEHPPLVKLLCAAPLLALGLNMPPTEPQGESRDFNSYQQLFGTQFLFTQDADRILRRGRLPVVVLGALLGWILFRWSSAMHRSAAAGLLSLGLFSLEPTLLAHSHYVTTDVALACFGCLALYSLWRFSLDGRARSLALATLGLGLALASKFSAVFLLPVFFVLLVVFYPRPASIDSPWLGRAGRFGACGLSILGAAVIVQASYFFSLDPLLYWKGIQTVNLNHVPGYMAYAAGNFYRGGVWWYPFYAVLMKMPLPTLGLIGAGVFWHVRRREAQRRDLAFVLLPAAVLTLATSSFADNIGVRYMIPVMALMLVLAGGALAQLWPSRAGRAAALLLALWLVLSVGHAAPHFVSYFNEIGGGPANGPYFLDDSNVDWGQDLRRLTAYLSDRQIHDVVLSFWGTAIPEYYGDPLGIQFRPWTQAMARSASPPPAIYAISANNLVGIRRLLASGGGDPALDWMSRFKPSDRVGYSIYIYDFRQGRPGA